MQKWKEIILMLLSDPIDQKERLGRALAIDVTWKTAERQPTVALDLFIFAARCKWV